MTYEEAKRLVIHGRYAEADEKIIEALEKQIPMKPIRYYYYCPRCYKIKEVKNWISLGQGFCDLCGQAIDWSVGNDL